jgi:hypothetical protein
MSGRPPDPYAEALLDAERRNGKPYEPEELRR